ENISNSLSVVQNISASYPIVENIDNGNIPIRLFTTNKTLDNNKIITTENITNKVILGGEKNIENSVKIMKKFDDTTTDTENNSYGSREDIPFDLLSDNNSDGEEIEREEEIVVDVCSYSDMIIFLLENGEI